MMNKHKREGIERLFLTGVLSTIALSINSNWASTLLYIIAAYSLVSGIVYLRRK